MPPAGAANATGTVDEQRGRPSCGHHVRGNEVDRKACLRQTRILLLLLLLSTARPIPHQILPAPPFPPSPSRLHRVVAGRKVRRPLSSQPKLSRWIGDVMRCSPIRIQTWLHLSRLVLFVTTFSKVYKCGSHSSETRSSSVQQQQHAAAAATISNHGCVWHNPRVLKLSPANQLPCSACRVPHAHTGSNRGT
jgi:hypothetical protein